MAPCTFVDPSFLFTPRAQLPILPIDPSSWEEPAKKRRHDPDPAEWVHCGRGILFRSQPHSSTSTRVALTLPNKPRSSILRKRPRYRLLGFITYHAMKLSGAFAEDSAMLTSSVGLLAVGLFFSLQQYCRYRRLEQQKLLFETILSMKEDGKESKEDEKLKVETARQIQCNFMNLEFPFVFRKSLEFALFRTYAVPSISGLLEKTGIFESNCGLRYDDTDMLIAEMMENSFQSTRSQTALQRINAIHNQYRNEITNDDMLYVLSVFIFEPIRWIERVEWRPLCRAEQESLYIVWTHIGERMGIRNIPPSLEEYDSWNQKYEKEHMKFAKSNAVIGNATMDLFMTLAPSFLHPFGMQASYCLMDDRLRAAMGYPKEVHALLKSVLDNLFIFRKLTTRYLHFPRPRWLATNRSPSKDTPVKVPNFHVYKATYAKGYRTEDLGTAPNGKLMKECPFWKD